MIIINVIIILVLFLLIGYISGTYKDDWLFVKACGVSLVLIITALLSLAIAGGLVYILFAFLLHEKGSIFNILVISILAGGFLQFFFVRYMMRLNAYNETLIEILEYFIQWTTILFTLYQFIVTSKGTMAFISTLKINTHSLNITLLNIVILPVLLISWIGIAMTKVYIKDHYKDE